MAAHLLVALVASQLGSPVNDISGGWGSLLCHAHGMQFTVLQLLALFSLLRGRLLAIQAHVASVSSSLQQRVQSEGATCRQQLSLPKTNILLPSWVCNAGSNKLA